MGEWINRPSMSSTTPHLKARFARAKFRSWHRGTREADYTFGGYYDRYSGEWGEAELIWFEALLDEDDVDVLAWAFKTAEVPSRFEGAMMAALQRLDFVDIPR